MNFVKFSTMAGMIMMASPAYSADVKKEAETMANFLRASRSVVTKRKNVIKDATKIPDPD